MGEGPWSKSFADYVDANGNLFKFAFTATVTDPLSVRGMQSAMAGVVLGALFALPFVLFRVRALFATARPVLRQAASGRSNTEIATLLSNSNDVIKNHCSAVCAKMGVRDRMRSTLRTMDLGWI